MTATTERTPLLMPNYGFTGSGRLSPSACLSSFDAGYFLMVNPGWRTTEYYTLREADSPMPEGAYNCAALVGGRQPYFRSVNYSNYNLPWWLRLAEGIRESFTVWGRLGRESKIYDPTRIARTNSGRGAIYSRWPFFGRDGNIVRYHWEVRLVEFSILDRQPAKGDKLRVTVDAVRGFLELGEASDDELIIYGRDDHWQQLFDAARAGFNAKCTDQPSPETMSWWRWFQGQRKLAEADTTRHGASFFDTSVRGRGWLAALDAVSEAWQLPIAVQAYSGMFPQVPPDPDCELDPGYTGTTGSMEARLLEAYYEWRPARQALLEKWMADYVVLLSNSRNYTGD
jgi:hypothetical protein